MTPFSVASSNNFKDTVKVFFTILAALLTDEIIVRPYLGMNNYWHKQLKILKKMGGKDENQESDSSFYRQNSSLIKKF